jgi:sugar lactone lactonase YvrE
MNRKSIYLIAALLIAALSLAASIIFVSAQAPKEVEAPAQPGVTLGQPGLSYRYVKTFGLTDVAYNSDTNHLNRPSGLYMDDSNRLYIIEEVGFRLLGFNSTQSNILEVGKAGSSNNARDQFSSPKDVTKDANGYLWVADWCRIVQFDGSGIFQQSFPAENDRSWECGDSTDRLNDVTGVAFDNLIPAQHLYVSNWGNHSIRVFTIDTTNPANPPVYVNTIGSTDGTPGSDNTHFNHPGRLTVDGSNRLYIVDGGNDRIQRCQGTSGSGDPWQTWTCDTFIETLNSIHLAVPRGVTVAQNGDIYITDSNNGRIIKWDGAIFTEFITGFPGYPDDVAVDTSGNVYVSDWRHVVRKYNSAGSSSVVWLGTLDVPYVTTSSLINKPWGLGIGSDGSVYVGEDYGKRVVKILPNGSQAWAFGVPGVEGNSSTQLGAYWGGVMGSIAIDNVSAKVYGSNSMVSSMLGYRI